MIKKNDWYVSIVVIIIAMIGFWPLGCGLLYLRWLKKEGKYKANNKVLLIAAAGLLLIGIIGIAVSTTETEAIGAFVALIMFLIPGIICGYLGIKRENKVKGYKKYLDYINVRKQVKIDDMCDKLNIDYETAIVDLTSMINKDMLKGYITNDELIINKIDVNGNIISENKETKKETKIVKCKECGAKNTIIIGEKKECEYCGTILQ